MSIVALYLEIGEELEATFLTPNCQGDGKFDESTRAVITRRHGARGYPKTGFLNTPQIKALLTESVSAAHASTDNRCTGPHGGQRASGPDLRDGSQCCGSGSPKDSQRNGSSRGKLEPHFRL